MEDPTISNWIVDLMVILAAGLMSGLLCKRLGISLLVGYLIVGAVIGGGGLQFVTQEHHEIEWVARTGALLLLFSIGMEFSLGELRRLSRYFLSRRQRSNAARRAAIDRHLAAAGMELESRVDDRRGDCRSARPSWSSRPWRNMGNWKHRTGDAPLRSCCSRMWPWCR